MNECRITLITSGLVEHQLAEVFDVSRMRIRSVLQSLAHDKVVTLHRNRGAVVAYPSVREAKEVFAARRLIEAALAPDIVAKADAKVLQRLRMHVKRENQGEAKANRALELKTPHDLHTLLAEITGNGQLIGFIERGDAQGLAKAMRQHLDEIEGDLVLCERQEFSADIRAVFAP
jgi:DNA-binding GntR family transcriptional regulator